jgi:hypothetical protein
MHSPLLTYSVLTEVMDDMNILFFTLPEKLNRASLITIRKLFYPNRYFIQAPKSGNAIR